MYFSITCEKHVALVIQRDDDRAMRPQKNWRVEPSPASFCRIMTPLGQIDRDYWSLGFTRAE